MKKVCLYIFIVLASVGCAATTPYQKESAFNLLVGGYADQRISDSEYSLVYRGTIHTSYEELESMWNRRASELCPSGYEKEIKSTERPQDYSTYAAGVIISNTIMLPTVEGTVQCN